MKEVLQLEFQLFLLALGRLTRFPIPSELPSSDDLDIRALRYYSLVGALVGLWGACALWGAALFLPPFPALLISLIATLMITAAFHELGLAEVSEALGRGRSKPDVLDALQKPPGLFGALVLGMVLMLKLSLLASLPVSDAGLALIVGLTLGQMASVHVVGTTPQARRIGMPAAVPSVTPDGYRIALAVGVLALSLIVIRWGPVAALFGFLGSVGLAQGFRKAFIAKLRGYTGACLGGVQQFAELGFYLGLLVWL